MKISIVQGNEKKDFGVELPSHDLNLVLSWENCDDCQTGAV